MKESKIKALTIFISILFFAALLVFWGGYYPNHLVQKEQMQLFLLSFDYLVDHLSLQGGFAIYLGEFLTQFFLYPYFGSFVVSALILLFLISIQKVLHLLFGDPFHVLAFVPAVGYCFMLFNDFYLLSGLLAVTITVWMIVLYIGISKANIRFPVGVILILLIYWLFGGSYLLFLLSIIAIELLTCFRTKSAISKFQNCIIEILSYFLLGVMIPLIARHSIIRDTLLQSVLSSAYYKFSLVFPVYLILIFLSVPSIILAHGILTTNTKAGRNLQIFLGAVILLFSGYGFFTFPDFKEEKEMKYDNLVYNQKWNEAIKLAETDPPKGQKGRLALMLSLGQTGQLSTRLFSFNPDSTNFFIPYTLHGMAPLISNEPYFYLGLTNFAQMLAMETIESTPDGSMPVRSVRRYIETCIIKGQYDVAAKYLRYLQNTLFYRKWASNAIALLYSDDKVNTHPVWGKLRAREVKDNFYFQNGKNDLALICLLRGNLDNQLAYEYLMSSFLLQKDFDQFLKFLPLIKSMNYPEIPLAYQEALAYIETLLPETPDALKQFPVGDDVRTRIKLYANAFKNGGNNDPKIMKKAFGNTYWYYVHFSELHEK